MRAIAIAVGLCLPLFGLRAARAVEVGDKAPVFEAKDDTGKIWKSEDHIGKDGKIIVLYFFPADLTGGCTKQACGFRDDMQTLKDRGVEVIGVSGDSVKNHQLFKKVKNLNFTLLADEHGSVAKAFGVPVNPGKVFKYKHDGKDESLLTGVRAARWTFIIDKQGKIASKNTRVNAAQDSKAVLGVVESLN